MDGEMEFIGEGLLYSYVCVSNDDFIECFLFLIIKGFFKIRRIRGRKELIKWVKNMLFL